VIYLRRSSVKCALFTVPNLLRRETLRASAEDVLPVGVEIPQRLVERLVVSCADSPSVSAVERKAVNARERSMPVSRVPARAGFVLGSLRPVPDETPGTEHTL